MRPFDNRLPKDIAKDYLSIISQKDFRLYGRPHFIFSVNGKKIAYCHIRKNACTSFKNAIISLSPYKSYMDEDTRSTDFLLRYHLARTRREINSCDEKIFVYRDPIFRAASLYINKFVVEHGGDILANFQKTTGHSAQRASFKDFVCMYLKTESWESLDPHVIPQKKHLHDIYYTAAVDMEEIFQSMKTIFGTRFAESFFSKRLNATPKGRLDVREVEHIPAADLHEEFRRSGRLPQGTDLLRGEMRPILEQVYREDLELLKRIKAS